MPRWDFNRSIGAQLALGNGAMLAAMIAVASAVFYFGTVGAFNRSIDAKITQISNRLAGAYGHRPVADLCHEIDQELHDGIDTDTEIFLVTSPLGEREAGNLSSGLSDAPLGRLVDLDVIRDGKRVSARIFVRRLPNGDLLYIGRDLREQRAIRGLVFRALAASVLASLGLATIGAYFFRRQIEVRISHIRHAAGRIEAGNLASRIEISGDDEFARLSVDINRMLDRIEQLVDGVRHVSNAVAHDLRTPLTRIRSGLDDAANRDVTAAALSDAAHTAIAGIDDLILVFDKLLQIAEAESGLRTETFETLDLNRILKDMAELYDATAEVRGVELHVGSHAPVWARGDHDLLASAVASLIDNAIKYAGQGCRVDLFAYLAPEGATLVVRDNGVGVPPDELPKMAERFYRLDRARNQPGNGLGLSIVSAIATLHNGTLQLANSAPGLLASIVLPAAPRPGGEAAIDPADSPPPSKVARLSNP